MPARWPNSFITLNRSLIYQWTHTLKPVSHITTWYANHRARSIVKLTDVEPVRARLGGGLIVEYFNSSLTYQ